MNSVNLTGRLCADIELRRTNDGTAVCSYSLAVKRPMVKDATDFPDIVSWRQSAEYLAQYAHKGDVVAVTGSLQSREWTDKDGKKRKSWEVVTTSVELLSGKKSEGNNQPVQNQNGYPGGYSGPQQGVGGNPQGYNANSYERQVNAPQYPQQGFGGYQQGAFQGTARAPANPPQANYPVVEEYDEQLPF